MMDHNLIPSSSSAQGNGGNYIMPPPLAPLPFQQQQQQQHQQQQFVASPHYSTGSQQHAGSIFQFSEAHIGLAQNSDKEENSLAISSPHATPPVIPSFQPPSDTMLNAITSYNDNDNEMLQDNSFDVTSNLGMENALLSSISNARGQPQQQQQQQANTSGGASAFDLFDNDNDYSMDSQHDIDLSPQTFSEGSNTFPGMSDNSNPLHDTSVQSGSSPQSSLGAAQQGDSGMSTHAPRPKGRPAKAGPRQIASCALCNKTFNNSSALAKHKLTHSDERKYVCNICSKAFKRQDHLNGHMMTHRSKKPFECKYEGCDKSYCDARSLRRHLENHHQVAADSFPGEVAGAAAGPAGQQFFQFDSASRQQFLSSHASAATAGSGDKSPSFLGQQSPISPALNPSSPHQQGNRPLWKGNFNPLDEPKPVQCSVCSRRFKNMPALNGHMRLHGGYFRKDTSPEKEGGGEEIDDKKTIPANLATLSTVRQQLLQQANNLGEASSSSSTMPIIIKPEQGKVAPSSSSSSSSSLYSGGTVSTQQPPARERLCQAANNPVLQHLHKQQILKQQLISEEQQQPAVHSPSYSTGNYNPPTSLYNTSSLQQQQENSNNAAAAAMFGLDHLAVATSQHQQQPLLRRNHIPPPLNPMAGSCPSTPLTPLTPSHPVTPHSTPNHPLTPNHVLPQQSNANNPLTPHTPHTPQLSHMHQHQQQLQQQHHHQQHHQHAQSLPCTPSHPLTPNHPNTPLTPNPSHHQTRHFHFPPPEPLQDTSTYTQPLHLQQFPGQQQQQQQFGDGSQQQQQQFASDPLDQHGGMDARIRQELEALQAEQEIREISRELQRHEQDQQLQQELQELTESMQQSQLQHPFMDGLDDGLDISMEHSHQNNQSKNAMGTVSITTSSTSTSSTQQPNTISHKVKVVDDLTVSSKSTAVAAFPERKRRASADPDNFTQPKRGKPDSSKSSQDIATKVAVWSGSGESSEQQGEAAGEDGKQEKPVTNVSSSKSNNDDKFVSPGEPAKRGLAGKKKHRPEPLIIPASVSHYGFHSKLRSPRLGGPSHRTPPPYTPPPMLSPVRSGSGLFWSLDSRYGPITPKSAPVFPRSLVRRPSIPSNLAAIAATVGGGGVGTTIPLPPPPIEEVEEEPPETDILPHVNIGDQYQAEIPDYIGRGGPSLQCGPAKEDLMWHPELMQHISEEEIQYYQDFACCAAIPGNGTNKEYALHLLQLCKGNFKKAMLKLMQGDHRFPAKHTLLSYKYQESDSWSPEEVEGYHQALMKLDKDFFSIAKELGSKSVKQCVQFYYLWKKVCGDEYKRLRIIRRKREQEELYNLRTRQQTEEKLASNAASPKSTNGEIGGSQLAYACEFDNCTASFPSKQALSCHVRIHGSPRPSPRPSPVPSPAPSNASDDDGLTTVFPCKVCGKVFNKVKSRSAHMKRHKSEQMAAAPPPQSTAFITA